jgi:Uma2 family endonuclease
MELLLETVAEKELSDYEIERGKPMPSTNHSIIQDNISFELNLKYRKEYKILPELSLDTPFKGSVPDLAIYHHFELDLNHDIIKRDDPPLVTIEILSPEQKLQDLIDKTFRYFAFGVRSCWIVIPNLKTIIVYSGIDEFEYFKKNSILKDPNNGFELDVSKIF